MELAALAGGKVLPRWPGRVPRVSVELRSPDFPEVVLYRIGDQFINADAFFLGNPHRFD